MATETALVLDTDAAGYTGGEPVHFAGFPGAWAPGKPIAVDALGLGHRDRVRELVHELGLPLKETRVPAGSAPLPPMPSQVVAADEPAAAEGEAVEQAPAEDPVHEGEG